MPDKFDAVWVRFVVVHVPDPLVLLQAAVSCLKPGGILLVEDTTHPVHLLYVIRRRMPMSFPQDARQSNPEAWRGPNRWCQDWQLHEGAKSKRHQLQQFCPSFWSRLQTSALDIYTERAFGRNSLVAQI